VDGQPLLVQALDAGSSEDPACLDGDIGKICSQRLQRGVRPTKTGKNPHAARVLCLQKRD